MSQLLEHTCKNCRYSDTIRSAIDEINFKCSECLCITGLEKDESLECGECQSQVITQWDGDCPKCGGVFEISYKTAGAYEELSRTNPHSKYSHSGYNWGGNRDKTP